MLVDSHCHFDVAAFDNDRSAVLQRARTAGVTKQVIPAITQASFTQIHNLCAHEVGLYPAYGLHPMYVEEHLPEHLDILKKWLTLKRPIAVGECGLDFFTDHLDAEKQREYFQRQLELAHDFSLPVILHARRALDEVIASLRRIGKLTGVVHSYSGSEEQARQLWKLGFYISFGGTITYERAKRLRHIVTHMPIEQLLLETDSPDQPLAGHQGERNEPSRLLDVLHAAAQLRGMDPLALAKATSQNAEALFHFSQWDAVNSPICC